ncbi:MAG: Holliday junction resolvase RuvX [Oscillospiraceae bacterium]|nr:Holliday junction resolvase RuvX [Oscillospiraceae bacterium]
MRIMAIDYGDARTGIAVSDMTGMMAGEAFVIADWNRDRAAEKIAQAAAERGAERLVMGLPRNMDGSLGPRAEKCMEMADILREKTGLEVVMWDERRTTIDAHRILSDNGRRTKNHRKNVDAVAAALILEGYLASL